MKGRYCRQQQHSRGWSGAARPAPPLSTTKGRFTLAYVCRWCVYFLLSLAPSLSLKCIAGWTEDGCLCRESSLGAGEMEGPMLVDGTLPHPALCPHKWLRH